MRNLHWFRSDLRVTDNKALTEAIRTADELITIFIITPQTWHYHDAAAIKVQFILNNLATLSATLAKQGIPLLVEQTDHFVDCPKILHTIAKKYQIDRLYFNKQYEWDERQRDNKVIATLACQDIVTYAYDDQTILSPGKIINQQGKPLKIFTPFKKNWLLNTTHSTNWKPIAKSQKKFSGKIKSTIIPSQVSGFHYHGNLDLWPAGEKQAQLLLTKFCQNNLLKYHLRRDYPAFDCTSKLSPYLAQGVLSVRQCIHATMKTLAVDSISELLNFPGPSVWLSELIWRDFYKHIMYCFPEVCWHQPMRKETTQLHWNNNSSQFQAWRKGQTGFPLVDAAMRQLNQTGWMHNRLRMVTAMFLAKILFLDWRLGERYFMQKLIDGDLAANNGGWQWCASTGTDAVPYFRIFNPMLQSKYYDPDGVFIKKYCPELISLAPHILHNPYLHHDHFKILNYPNPIVDYTTMRQEVIQAFKNLQKK